MGKKKLKVEESIPEMFQQTARKRRSEGRSSGLLPAELMELWRELYGGGPIRDALSFPSSFRYGESRFRTGVGNRLMRYTATANAYMANNVSEPRLWTLKSSPSQLYDDVFFLKCCCAQECMVVT
ncbi:unnamed protein product [Microthlaspi erraticum]|uniref:Uncharacterized protein n=1 Tax=Microthlaspi erraticum TaxID=1685480 RepID=A0A6D2J9H4_9BRAS|nr:unnamed protein product [Microthlaspi erraticum]